MSELKKLSKFFFKRYSFSETYHIEEIKNQKESAQFCGKTLLNNYEISFLRNWNTVQVMKCCTERFKILFKMQNVHTKKMTTPKRKVGHWMCYGCCQVFFNIIVCDQLALHIAKSLRIVTMKTAGILQFWLCENIINGFILKLLLTKWPN